MPIFQKIQCDLCGSIDQKIIHSSRETDQNRPYCVTEENLCPPSRIARCNNCGLIFAIQDKDQAAFLTPYINMVDEKYLEEEDGRRASAQSILKKLDRFKRPGGRLLDIGCCAGFLLDEARLMGWDASGVEPSIWASQYAVNKFNLRVYNTPLDKAGFLSGSFDLVIMQDTIEHLQSPRQALLEAYRILKTNGILYINTPDIESAASRLLKAKWWGVNQFHLYYFSKRSLKKMLNSSGFVILKYDSYARSFTLNYWTERFKNYNRLIYRVLKLFSNIGILKKRFIRINLRDQIEVFARKTAG